jgi:hypothetical protein
MKATRKESIARKLKQWSRLAQRQKQIEAERDRKLAPLTEKYEQACAPIMAAADARLSVLQQELSALASQIESELKAGTKPDGTVEIQQVTVDDAIASVKSTPTREIPAQEFYKAFPASQRDNKFWSCLKVLLGNSTELIGAQRVESLAKKTYSHKVEIGLK